MLQTDFSVDVFAAPTLGSVFGRTSSDLDLSPASANASGGAGADFIYLYYGAYYSFCFMPAGIRKSSRLVFNSYIGWGLQNDVVLYPDEAFIVSKRTQRQSYLRL